MPITASHGRVLKFRGDETKTKFVFNSIPQKTVGGNDSRRQRRVDLHNDKDVIFVSDARPLSRRDVINGKSRQRNKEKRNATTKQSSTRHRTTVDRSDDAVPAPCTQGPKGRGVNGGVEGMGTTSGRRRSRAFEGRRARIKIPEPTGRPATETHLNGIGGHDFAVQLLGQEHAEFGLARARTAHDGDQRDLVETRIHFVRDAKAATATTVERGGGGGR